MESGGTMTGSFDWNATTAAVLGFDITMPANGDGPVTTFDTGNAVYAGGGVSGTTELPPRDSSMLLILNDNTAYLNLISIAR